MVGSPLSLIRRKLDFEFDCGCVGQFVNGEYLLDAVVVCAKHDSGDILNWLVDFQGLTGENRSNFIHDARLHLERRA